MAYKVKVCPRCGAKQVSSGTVLELAAAPAVGVCVTCTSLNSRGTKGTADWFIGQGTRGRR